jgi:hypothetical protein
MLVLGCKDETTNTTSERKTNSIKSKKTSLIIEDFDCDTLFKKGDYKSLCFIDSKLPKTISRGCIFDFEVKGDKQEQSIKIQFTNKNSTMLAEMHHNLNKNNYKKGSIIDVTKLGDAAYFDVHGTDLKSLSRSHKDLHVRYKNITFILFAEYMSTTEKPCFFNDDELIAFAKAIIDNL